MVSSQEFPPSMVPPSLNSPSSSIPLTQTIPLSLVGMITTGASMCIFPYSILVVLLWYITVILIIMVAVL